MEKGAECGRRQRADGRWSTEANYGSVESRSWSFSDSENGVSDTLTVGPREDKGHQDSLASPPEEWYRPTMSDVLGNCEANDQTNGTVENYDDNVDENDDENNDENNDEIYNENDEFSVEKDEEASLEEENIEDDLINGDDIMTTMNNKRNQDKSEPCYDVDQVIECE